MIKSIDVQISELPLEDRNRFLDTLESAVTSSSWMELRGLEGAGIAMAAKVLYGEMFENDFSYLHRGRQDN